MAELPLLQGLAQAAQRSRAAFHTPGHKQGRMLIPPMRDLLQLGARADLPELPELDTLFAPSGLILQAQQLAAQAFGAEQTWFLANGSTGGILAALLAIAPDLGEGGQILMPRNVHQSVVSGLILAGLDPVFLTPQIWDGLAQGLTAAQVESALHPTVRAVLLVSPTYYGVCSEVAAIAALCHARDIPLVVDEAHGAHFAFHPTLPPTALAQGADLVIQSTHKTLGALTQAAMAHAQGHLINRDRLSAALRLVQSTSPNYLLLASLDAARHHMQTEGREQWGQAITMAQQLRSRLQQIPGITLLELPPNIADITRITLRLANLDGFSADAFLHQEYGVTCELPSLHHLSFILTPGNCPSDCDRLVHSLQQLFAQFPHPAARPHLPDFPHLPAKTHCTPRFAFFSSSISVPADQAIGAISAALVCPYPPGIPVLMPGEVITAEAVDYLQQVQAQGGMISGGADERLANLQVLEARPCEF